MDSPQHATLPEGGKVIDLS